ncbi:MAG: ABC-type transport auxiliary lipoprotein family protein [Xanthomonadaceae bacterium]|nr:ABC-type transport auxiliary lipoprotein family protein [Xanthomonadaceae bacterium]MDP2184163.1 ABC-type transport auxiliary lipoprotein family protein [Xanthomonadales bacterium]MDZ4114437.1 ABC-type transport auxiliary lipoprotein family protein [Xanthomonadaceae bacterium]MDZ4376738.1 ABC-type transport auxiliary lipoprotein family protein [Xanthomonadaceae bacterium]
MKRTLSIAVAIVLLGALTGCVSLPEREAVQLYTPTLASSDPNDAPSVPWQLVIDRPLSDPALDSPRIAVRPRANELQSYAGARWTAAAPDIVETALLRRFQDSGRIVAVGRARDALRADYLLQLDLRAFESVYDGDSGVPHAHIALFATVLDAGSRNVIAGRLFVRDSSASDEAVPAIVDAFGVALSALSTEIVDWTLTNGQAHAERTH